MTTRQPLDISELYARHGDTLLVFFARRTLDPEVAADLFAETFAQALASRARFRGEGQDAEAAWLYKIAHRQLARYVRRGAVERRAQRKLELERPEFTEEAGAALMQRAGLKELRSDLAKALAELPHETRAAIQLRIVDDLSYEEVASHLNTSEQNARARVSRGLRALGDLLDPQMVTEVAR